MSIETRCKCGWCGPISEVYLGGKIDCPGCGEQLDVNTPSAPYAYPPFPAWESQRRPAPRLPRPRAASQFNTDQTRTAGVEAWNALGLSVAALILSFGRFSWIAAVVLAICGIVAASRTGTLALQQHRPRPVKAHFASGIAVLALLFSLGSMLSGLPCSHKRAVPKPVPVKHMEGSFDLTGQDANADLHDCMEHGRDAATRRFLEGRSNPDVPPRDADTLALSEKCCAADSTCKRVPPERAPLKKDPARETRSDWSDVNGVQPPASD